MLIDDERRSPSSFFSPSATTLAIAGIVVWFDDHDVATAFELFDRALSVSNSNVVALSNSAFVLAWMGKTAEAIQRAERAIRLSPFDTSNAHLALAVANFHSGHFDRSRDAARRAVEAHPVFSVPRALLAASLVRLNRTEDATAEARRLLELDPTFTTRNWSVTVGLAPEVFTPFADALHEAGVPAGLQNSR